MRWSMPCPHCGARGIARGKEQTDELHWIVDFQCDSVTCGHTYRTALTIEPAVTPVPKVSQRQTLSLFDDSPDDAVGSDGGDEPSPENLKGV